MIKVFPYLTGNTFNQRTKQTKITLKWTIENKTPLCASKTAGERARS